MVSIKNKKYKRTRWKRIKNSAIIGIRFFTDECGLSGFFVIKKLWKCQVYNPCAENHNGSHWFDEAMMLIVTDDGRKFKMPFFPWLKAYDDNEKSFSQYYNEHPWLN